MQNQIFPPKKILFLTYHSNIGGGETTLLSFLSKLDRKKFKATVIIPNAGQLQKELSRLKIKTIILPLPGYLIRTLFIPGMSPTYLYRFYKLVKKVKPDLIHINHLNLVLYAGISTKILKIPTIATAHGNWDSIYFFQDLITNIFTDKILANTLQTAKSLKRRKIISEEKIKTVYFGVDINYFRPTDKIAAKKSLKLNSSDLIISIVGRLDPIKDHLTFLKAAKIVNQKIIPVKFLIVGSQKGDFSNQNNNYSKQIKNFLKLNPELSRKIILLGFKTKMPQIYQATDILVSLLFLNLLDYRLPRQRHALFLLSVRITVVRQEL